VRVIRTNKLAAARADYEKRGVTYSDLGATRRVLPAGYHHSRMRRSVGKGERDFARAVELVRTWDMHRGAGMAVSAAGPAVEGQTVALAVPKTVGFLIPCRVIYTVDQPRVKGFGYGTLPGHPESGEEAFLVRIDDSDQVWLEVTAFTKPGAPLVKLAGPIARLLQQLALRAYVRSVRRQLAQ